MQNHLQTSSSAHHHAQLLESIADAARRLGVGRSTIYELLKTNQLEAVKIGRARRVVIASAVSWSITFGISKQPEPLLMAYSHHSAPAASASKMKAPPAPLIEPAAHQAVSGVSSFGPTA